MPLKAHQTSLNSMQPPSGLPWGVKGPPGAMAGFLSSSSNTLSLAPSACEPRLLCQCVPATESADFNTRHALLLRPYKAPVLCPAAQTPSRWHLPLHGIGTSAAELHCCEVYRASCRDCCLFQMQDQVCCIQDCRAAAACTAASQSAGADRETMLARLLLVNSRPAPGQAVQRCWPAQLCCRPRTC